MKELIIILYKLNIHHLTAQKADLYLNEMKNAYTLSEDEELKENYIIREIFLPIRDDDGETDIKIIYPVPRYTTSPEINDLVKEISEKIKEDPTNTLKLHWERLVRELKLIKINNI